MSKSAADPMVGWNVKPNGLMGSLECWWWKPGMQEPRRLMLTSFCARLMQSHATAMAKFFYRFDSICHLRNKTKCGNEHVFGEHFWKWFRGGNKTWRNVEAVSAGASKWMEKEWNRYFIYTLGYRFEGKLILLQLFRFENVAAAAKRDAILLLDLSGVRYKDLKWLYES